MSEIRIDDLIHVYKGGVRALDGVTLMVRPGEQVALVGQNGSGKTTLVRHLNGLLRPSAGSVHVGGQNAATRTVAQLARTVGLVYQNPDRQIFASRVGAEVAFGPRNVGLRGERARGAVTAALAAAGLAGEEDTNPYDLGPSRRRLLALASVLAMETPIVVLDEPTTGQDQAGIEIVERVLESLRAAGRTVIAISHDMSFVAEHFARVVAMRQGRVVLDGSPAETFAASSWEALRGTFLEPPLAAVVGHRLGLGSTPTDGALVDALRARG